MTQVYKKRSTRHTKLYKALELQGASKETLELSEPRFHYSMYHVLSVMGSVKDNVISFAFDITAFFSLT